MTFAGGFKAELSSGSPFSRTERQPAPQKAAVLPATSSFVRFSAQAPREEDHQRRLQFQAYQADLARAMVDALSNNGDSRGGATLKPRGPRYDQLHPQTQKQILQAVFQYAVHNCQYPPQHLAYFPEAQRRQIEQEQEQLGHQALHHVAQILKSAPSPTSQTPPVSRAAGPPSARQQGAMISVSPQGDDAEPFNVRQLAQGLGILAMTVFTGWQLLPQNQTPMVTTSAMEQPANPQAAASTQAIQSTQSNAAPAQSIARAQRTQPEQKLIDLSGMSNNTQYPSLHQRQFLPALQKIKSLYNDPNFQDAVFVAYKEEGPTSAPQAEGFFAIRDNQGKVQLYDMISGGRGKGKIPPGAYSFTGRVEVFTPQQARDEFQAAMCIGNYCFWLPISDPANGRGPFGIHPVQGGVDGTSRGCPAIAGGVEIQKLVVQQLRDLQNRSPRAGFQVIYLF
jgi:hypothetical protein